MTIHWKVSWKKRQLGPPWHPHQYGVDYTLTFEIGRWTFQFAALRKDP